MLDITVNRNIIHEEARTVVIVDSHANTDSGRLDLVSEPEPENMLEGRFLAHLWAQYHVIPSPDNFKTVGSTKVCDLHLQDQRRMLCCTQDGSQGNLGMVLGATPVSTNTEIIDSLTHPRIGLFGVSKFPHHFSKDHKINFYDVVDMNSGISRVDKKSLDDSIAHTTSKTTTTSFSDLTLVEQANMAARFAMYCTKDIASFLEQNNDLTTIMITAPSKALAKENYTSDLYHTAIIRGRDANRFFLDALPNGKPDKEYFTAARAACDLNTGLILETRGAYNFRPIKSIIGSSGGDVLIYTNLDDVAYEAISLFENNPRVNLIGERPDACLTAYETSAKEFAGNSAFTGLVSDIKAYLRALP